MMHDDNTQKILLMLFAELRSAKKSLADIDARISVIERAHQYVFMRHEIARIEGLIDKCMNEV